MNQELGNIAIFKSLVFNNNLADHASLIGRPCLVLGEKKEKMYLIPISSKNDSLRFKIYHYPISKEDLEFDNMRKGLSEESSLHLDEIIKHELCGYNTKCKIKLSTYYKILKKILSTNYLNTLSKNNFEEIKEELKRQKNYLKQSSNFLIILLILHQIQ